MGLIGNKRDFGRFGDVTAFLHLGNLGLIPSVDPIDYRDRVFTRFTQQRAVHASLAVDANDVVLQRRVIDDFADVPNEDRLGCLEP